MGTYLQDTKRIQLRVWPEEFEALKALAKKAGFVRRDGMVLTSKWVKSTLFNSVEYQNYMANIKE